MEWSSWRNYYETNRSRPAPEVCDAPEVSGEERRRALARSFAVFQLGEAGEGRIATEIDRTHLGTIDDDYRVSLKHWVREEGRHGRVLGTAVRALGGRPESKNWTNDLLVVGRRLLGIRLKLLVILTAEVVATARFLISNLIPAVVPATALTNCILISKWSIRRAICFRSGQTANC